MSQVFHFVKIAGAVILTVAGTVCLFVAQPYALPCFAGGIAWSVMPE